MNLRLGLCVASLAFGMTTVATAQDDLVVTKPVHDYLVEVSKAEAARQLAMRVESGAIATRADVEALDARLATLATQMTKALERTDAGVKGLEAALESSNAQMIESLAKADAAAKNLEAAIDSSRTLTREALAKTDAEIKAIGTALETSTAQTRESLTKTDAEIKAIGTALETSTAQTRESMGNTSAAVQALQERGRSTDERLAAAATADKALAEQLAAASANSDASLIDVRKTLDLRFGALDARLTAQADSAEAAGREAQGASAAQLSQLADRLASAEARLVALADADASRSSQIAAVDQQLDEAKRDLPSAFGQQVAILKNDVARLRELLLQTDPGVSEALSVANAAKSELASSLEANRAEHARIIESIGALQAAYDESLTDIRDQISSLSDDAASLSAKMVPVAPASSPQAEARAAPQPTGAFQIAVGFVDPAAASTAIATINKLGLYGSASSAPKSVGMGVEVFVGPYIQERTAQLDAARLSKELNVAVKVLNPAGLAVSAIDPL